MELFRLIGIHSPGRVNVMKYGTIELENISDTIAVDLWRKGCPYLEPTDEGRKIFFPNEVKIDIDPIEVAPELVDEVPPTGAIPLKKKLGRKKNGG